MTSPPPPKKHHLTSSTRSISPPPLKRQRILPATSLSPSNETPQGPTLLHSPCPRPPPSPPRLHNSSYTTTTTTTTATTNESPGLKHFHIISWNVNGIEWLLPPHSTNQDQKSITSFFPSSSQRYTSPQGASDSEASDGVSASVLRAFLRRHNWPAVLCLQEVKIARSDGRVMGAVERAANLDLDGDLDGGEVRRVDGWREKDGEGEGEGEGEGKHGNGKTDAYAYNAHFSLPRDKFNARGLGGKGKVYGVCTLVREDYCAEKYAYETGDVGWDLEGRVLVTRLRLGSSLITAAAGGSKKENDTERNGAVDKEDTRITTLAILNSYWPNGTSSPWRCSRTGAVLGTRHDAKRRFHELMLDEVLTLEEMGFGVVIIGDVNVAPRRVDGWPQLRMGEEHVRSRADFNGRFLAGDGGNRGKERAGVKGKGGGRLEGVDAWRWWRGIEREGDLEARKQRGNGGTGFTYHGERKEEWGSRCDRVDLAIVGRGLVHGDSAHQAAHGYVSEARCRGEREGEKGKGVRLVSAQIWETLEERGESDHVPIGMVLGYESGGEGEGMEGEVSMI